MIETPGHLLALRTLRVCDQLLTSCFPYLSNFTGGEMVETVFRWRLVTYEMCCREEYERRRYGGYDQGETIGLTLFGTTSLNVCA